MEYTLEFYVLSVFKFKFDMTNCELALMTVHDGTDASIEKGMDYCNCYLCYSENLYT